VSLLHSLIRLGDDALADFLGRYVQGALEMYLQAKKSAQTFIPFNPFLSANNPFSNAPWAAVNQTPPRPVAAPPPASDVEQLRRELDELKRSLHKKKKA
jgi:hypothetical protein